MWILFKLGAERMFQEGLYVCQVIFYSGKQMATGGANLFYGSRNNTVFAYILKMVQDRVIVTNNYSQIGSHIYVIPFGTVFFDLA